METGNEMQKKDEAIRMNKLSALLSQGFDVTASLVLCHGYLFPVSFW